ncbi:MAG: 4a-hydroxytetrahydrobiopterin dehydratase [Candidatus Omnitrophica bacterium]|nr:4a-hydroxytetrahydrobiopterin dehydratase [Candidatus Omnitrophota bacterium]
MDPSDAKALSQRKCKPCEGGTIPLTEKEARTYLQFLPGWELDPNRASIRKLYVMKHFLAAVKLIDTIAQVAEAEDHHPDLHLTGYRKLLIELSTHAIKGLSENDFILASKIENLPKELKEPLC